MGTMKGNEMDEQTRLSHGDEVDNEANIDENASTILFLFFLFLC
jgi:hypothetical protein